MTTQDMLHNAGPIVGVLSVLWMIFGRKWRSR